MTTIGTGEEWKEMDENAWDYAGERSLQAVQQARANIPNIRQAPCKLKLLDYSGKPIAHLAVEIEQRTHSFPFGDQLWGLDTLYREGHWDGDRARYTRLRHAQALNAANCLCYWTERHQNDAAKTEDLLGEQKLEGFARCVEWAAGEGLIVKGHPLFWSIPKAYPEWLKRYPYETQLKFIEVRIRSIVSRFKGKVNIWDAVNEPVWEPAPKNLAHRHWPHLETTANMADYIQLILQWAREEDPDAQYVVNDYGLEVNHGKGPIATDGTEVTAAFQRKRFLDLMRELKQRGAAPNAMGLQSHTGGWMDHSVQISLYDEFATVGLPIQITEFWAQTNFLKKEGKLTAEQIQELKADYVENYLTCAFGHPAVNGFFFWGLHGVKWRDDHSGHELLPVWHRVKKLIHETWHTRLNLHTNEQGEISFRGYTGNYSLRVHNGVCGITSIPFHIQKGMEGTITINLPN